MIADLERDMQPVVTMPLSAAIQDFFAAKQAERKSLHTIADYSVTLKRLEEFVGGDVAISEITVAQATRFLSSLTWLSEKSLLNVHIALSSLWTWALDKGYCSEQIIRKITPPRPTETPIIPFTADQVAAMMEDPGEPIARNRAILAVLLDTGVRASELAGAKVGDIQDGSLWVLGKNRKYRSIPMSAGTLRLLLEYLSQRDKPLKPDEYLFLGATRKPLTRDTLGNYLEKLGDRVNISGVHPHRFRHTFAIWYLRNGGDAISLQKALGHSTLKMVEKYVRFSDEDLRHIHKRASPISNWNLDRYVRRTRTLVAQSSHP